MRSNRAFASFVVVLVLILPVATQAQTADSVQSMMFTLFNQIIALQKQLIQNLDSQVADFRTQLTAARALLTAALNDAASLRTELATSKSVLSSVNSQLSESQKQLSLTQSELTNVKGQLAVCKNPPAPAPSPTPPATTAGCTAMTDAQTTGGHNYCGDLICPNNAPSYRYWCSGGSIATPPHWSSTPCSGMFCMTRSDIRLKENVSLIQNALSKLSQLNSIFFSWKDSAMPQDRQMGVIAQEVQKVFPEAVFQDASGVLYVNYYALIAPIIEALKELKAENDALHAEIETIKISQ